MIKINKKKIFLQERYSQLQREKEEIVAHNESLRKNNDILENKNIKSFEKMGALAQYLQKLKDENKESFLVIDELRHKLENDFIVKSMFESDIEQLKNKLLRYEEDNEILISSYEDIQKEFSEIVFDREKVMSENELLIQNIEQKEDQILLLEGQLKDYGVLKEAVTDLQKNLDREEEQRTVLLTQVDTLKSHIVKQEEELERVITDKDQILSENELLTQNIEQKEEAVLVLEDQLKNYEVMKDAMSNLRMNLDKREEQKSVLLIQVDELKSHIVRQEEELERVITDKDRVVSENELLIQNIEQKEEAVLVLEDQLKNYEALKEMVNNLQTNLDREEEQRGILLTQVDTLKSHIMKQEEEFDRVVVDKEQVVSENELLTQNIEQKEEAVLVLEGQLKNYEALKEMVNNLQINLDREEEQRGILLTQVDTLKSHIMKQEEEFDRVVVDKEQVVSENELLIQNIKKKEDHVVELEGQLKNYEVLKDAVNGLRIKFR